MYSGAKAKEFGDWDRTSRRVPPRQRKITASKAAGRKAVTVLHSALAQIARGRAKTFTAIEPRFLQTMTAFDRLVVRGVPQADIRAKGDFFNDVLELLLERSSGKIVATRGNVDGLLLDHKLDMTYPDATASSVPPEIIVETKMAGTPQHRDNRKSTPPGGRRASQDLDKRIKEAAYKDVDIKGLHASISGTGGGGGGSLTAWLKSTPPKSYLLLAIRVSDPSDVRLSIEKGSIPSEAAGGLSAPIMAPVDAGERR